MWTGETGIIGKLINSLGLDSENSVSGESQKTYLSSEEEATQGIAYNMLKGTLEANKQERMASVKDMFDNGVDVAV